MGTVPDDADHRPPSLVIAVLAGAALLFGFFPAGLYDRLTKDVVITSGGRQPQRPSDAEPPPADR